MTFSNCKMIGCWFPWWHFCYTFTHLKILTKTKWWDKTHVFCLFHYQGLKYHHKLKANFPPLWWIATDKNRIKYILHLLLKNIFASILDKKNIPVKELEKKNCKVGSCRQPGDKRMVPNLVCACIRLKEVKQSDLGASNQTKSLVAT